MSILILAISVLVPTSLLAQSSSSTPYCSVSHGYTTSNYNGDPCLAPLAKIATVKVSNLNHTATCPDGRGIYTYWNNVAAVDLSPGSVVTFTLTSGATNAAYYNEWGVYLDLNGDGDFSDQDEFLFRGQTTAGPSSITKTLTIPCSAVAGKTRLRIRNDYSYNGSPYTFGVNNACNNSVYGNSGYGESWDFDVQMAAVSAPAANFTGPDSVYVNSPAKFVNINQSGYISHEWDVINQGNSPDATSVNFGYTFSSVGTYQVRLTSTNCNGTSITTKSFDVINPTSSPAPNFVVSQNEVVYDGVDPLYIDFFDLSQYGPTQWEWILTPDFLNGAPYFWSVGSQYDQNPSGFFYDVEIYDVCLAVGNSAGWDTLCKPGYINIKAPGAGSTFSNKMGQHLGSDLDSGLIYDSGGPTGNYGNNEYFEFLIAPCGASQVTLSFMNFNVAANDQLLVFDGPNSSSPLLGSYTGNNLPTSVTSTGGYINLIFLSNNTGNTAGFAATWGSIVPNNGAPNADFFVPDTVYQCSLGNEVIFENTSTGVLEDQASYDWILDFDPNVSYPTGYADVQDEFNAEWPYFSTGTHYVRMVLKSCEGNDTVVKSFVIDATASNPIVDFTSSKTILKVGDITELRENSVAGCEYEWVITPSTYTIENGADEYERNIDVKFTAPGSYNVKLIVTNDNGTTTHEKTNYIDVIEYCTPGVFFPTVADVGINKFVLGSYQKTSASGKAPGYSNYTGESAIELILGGEYSYEITRNSKVNGINRKIWIDYNRDGDFDDANELVASQTGATGSSFSGSFTVPGIDEVVAGEARLRVGVSLINTPLTACGPAQVGEYEDYTVILTPDETIPILFMIGSDEIIEVNSVYTDKGATATDNLEGNITAAIVVDNGVDVTQPGVYYVTYNVSDKSGNAAAPIYRKVTVVADLTPPTVTLNGGSTILWSVLVPFNDPGFTTLDLPSGNNVDHLVSVSGLVDVNAIGDYTLTYTVYDDYGNMSETTREVQVRDTTAPVVESDPVVQVQVGAPFVDPVIATDNFDQNPQLVKVSGNVNSNAIGTYLQSYKATDFSGNQSASTTVTFEVADFIAPKIHYVAGTEVVIVKVFDHNWEQHPNMQVTTSDNYYGFASLNVIYPAGFSVDVLGEYTITYEATDNGGNVSTFNRVVRVIDDVRPAIIANPVNLPRWSSYDFTQGLTVTDNYYAPGDFATASNGCEIRILRNNVDFNYPGIYEVCYQAIDGSGNMSAITCRSVQVSETGAMTGVEDLDMENNVSIYPNPNNGNFTIKLESPLSQQVSVSIVNAQGKVLQTLVNPEFINGEHAINLNGVAAGVYFVRIESGSQSVNKRVIIQ